MKTIKVVLSFVLEAILYAGVLGVLGGMIYTLWLALLSQISDAQFVCIYLLGAAGAYIIAQVGSALMCWAADRRA